MNESFIIQELKNGNSSALKELIDVYGKKVYNTSYNIVLHTDDAEEITQDVFIEVYDSIHNFDQRSKLSTWIYRIAVNKSLDSLRKRNRKKRFANLIRLGSKSSTELHPAHYDHPGALLEFKESNSLVFKTLDTLPEKQKTAFILKTTEDLPQKEIAAIMNITESAVESLLVRARDALRKELGKHFDQKEKINAGK